MSNVSEVHSGSACWSDLGALQIFGKMSMIAPVEVVRNAERVDENNGNTDGRSGVTEVNVLYAC